MYLGGREAHWADVNRVLSGWGRGCLVPHDVGQHLEPQQHEAAGGPLEPAEAAARRTGEDGEPEMAVVEVLARVVGEEVGEVLHLLTTGNRDETVDLSVRHVREAGETELNGKASDEDSRKVPRRRE